MSSTRCFLLIALLNCPLNKFWGLWSIHNIYGVLPLEAGTSTRPVGPQVRVLLKTRITWIFWMGNLDVSKMHNFPFCGQFHKVLIYFVCSWNNLKTKTKAPCWLKNVVHLEQCVLLYRVWFYSNPSSPKSDDISRWLFLFCTVGIIPEVSCRTVKQIAWETLKNWDSIWITPTFQWRIGHSKPFKPMNMDVVINDVPKLTNVLQRNIVISENIRSQW